MNKSIGYQDHHNITYFQVLSTAVMRNLLFISILDGRFILFWTGFQAIPACPSVPKE